MTNWAENLRFIPPSLDIGETAAMLAYVEEQQCASILNPAAKQDCWDMEGQTND